MDIMIPAWVDGTLTPVEKLEAHRRGLKHKAVSVFVMSQGKILIQQRAAHKYHTPTLWANTCCTHPEWGEEDGHCAIRRLDEELGITDLALNYRGTIEYRANVGDGLIEHEVVKVFVAETTEALPIAPNPDEVMATLWVDYDVLASQVEKTPLIYTPWLSIYLAQHSNLIFGDLIAAE